MYTNDVGWFDRGRIRLLIYCRSVLPLVLIRPSYYQVREVQILNQTQLEHVRENSGKTGGIRVYGVGGTSEKTSPGVSPLSRRRSLKVRVKHRGLTHD